MEDWKIRQLLFKKFGFKDDLIDFPVVKDLNNEELITGIKLQFQNSETTIHPYKSFCVALVYSINLSKKYGNTPIYYLNENLLPDDPCFKLYNQFPDIYDYFLKNIIWLDSPMGKKIEEYWVKEYVSDINYKLDEHYGRN